MQIPTRSAGRKRRFPAHRSGQGGDAGVTSSPLPKLHVWRKFGPPVGGTPRGRAAKGPPVLAVGHGELWVLLSPNSCTAARPQVWLTLPKARSWRRGQGAQLLGWCVESFWGQILLLWAQPNREQPPCPYQWGWLTAQPHRKRLLLTPPSPQTLVSPQTPLRCTPRRPHKAAPLVVLFHSPS